MSFSDQAKDIQVLECTVPQQVSITENPDGESYEQIVKRQDKFLTMPKDVKYKLASSDTGKKIQLIGQKYGFELLRLANITRLIREYYFREVRFEDFPSEIERRMGVSAFTAQEIARYLKSEIIDWDPWGEYIAKLPKMSVREIVVKRPKLADTEITAGYIELRNSEDPFNPTIKNWLHDYVLHLGQVGHSQMDRTQYLFHSENGKDLSSPDREKLSIILRSFDENIPLPIDEEAGEIIFDSVDSELASSAGKQQSVNTGQAPVNIPKPQSAPATSESFIKPYAPAPQPSRPAPVNIPRRPIVPATPPRKTAYQQPVYQPKPSTTAQPARPDTRSETDKELDKYFAAPESPEIPPIKIHSMTEHTAPRPVVPVQNISRPAQPQADNRPQHRIINPFTNPLPEPKIDGNIVDLRGEE